MLDIDSKKCVGDGICAAACPAGVIVLENGIPRHTEKAERNCINCGHCVAACPHGALGLPTMAPKECAVLPENWRLSPDQVEMHWKGRRSIRRFSRQEVDKIVLERLIDMSRYAPSGMNAQPVHWLVVPYSEQVKHMAQMTIDWIRYLIQSNSTLVQAFHLGRLPDAWVKGNDLICRQAPCLVLAHAEENNPLSPASCLLALTHLDLAAPAFGLGTCWAGYFHMAASSWPDLLQALHLPNGHKCFGALMVGYPKIEYRRIPSRIPSRITWFAE